MHTPFLPSHHPTRLLIPLGFLIAWLPGCPDDGHTPSEQTPVIIVDEDMNVDLDLDTPDPADMPMTPGADMPDTPACSVGEQCGDECVDTQSNTSHCGGCGNACDAGAPCVQGKCEAQVSDCRQEACQGFFYCDLSNGECLEGCDRDAQCQDNATCDVFAHECVCEESFHECAGQCVDSTSPQHCGDRCEPCPTPANGASICEADGSCGFVCDAGFHACGDRCVADNDIDHCGNRCDPCPTDPRGEAVCNASNQCEIVCDSDALLCNGACAACPAGAIDKVCQGNSCVVPNCPANERRCGGLCTSCPTTQGIAATTCSAQDACVVQSCQSGYKQCNNTCSTCPSQGVASTTCNTSDACVIDTCNAGLHPCGDTCCTWASNSTLIGTYQGISDFKMVRDGISLSISFSDADFSSFTDDTGYHVALNGSSWSTIETYDLELIPDDFDRRALYAWRQNNQNYAIIEDNQNFKLISPSGQNGWNELGSVAAGSFAKLRHGQDGSAYFSQKLNGAAETYYRVTPSSNQKFTALPLNTPDYADSFFIDSAGTYYGVNADFTTFNPTLDFWEQISSSQVSVSTIKNCASHGDDIVADEAGFATVLREECDSNEADGYWVSTQRSNGQWTHHQVANDGDFMGNLTIAPDGTVHGCFVRDAREVHHIYRAPNASSTWQSRRVYTMSRSTFNSAVSTCIVETTGTGKPYLAWYERNGDGPTIVYEVRALAPN